MVAHKAYEETLQYLLIEREGIVTPCVTSVFWADSADFYYEEEYFDEIETDFALLDKILLPKEFAMRKWKEYYDMDDNALKLLEYLYQIKAQSFYTEVFLNQEQVKLIPGPFINKECLEALSELNIFVKDTETVVSHSG